MSQPDLVFPKPPLYDDLIKLQNEKSGTLECPVLVYIGQGLIILEFCVFFCCEPRLHTCL